ncbi:hypothetical protein NA57DRAFT_52342 [Rhizodiscina lignyota]|uniref:Uncharacterized protein n=1 Tax=Rhizodiscina lignyota TaxID=1504668 RepID=A0A9P4MA28_9PEZI|nr:hypothetical protein NA57DRAFT_52342 [Rhizodiscina lignyota]
MRWLSTAALLALIGSAFAADNTASSTSFIPPAPTQLGIVCARFSEDLRIWLPFEKNTYVYDKGTFVDANDTVKHEDFRSYVKLNNTGREEKTYLYHILTHWNDLDDITLFTQASPDLAAPAANTTTQMVEIALHTKEDEVNNINPDLFHALAEWKTINWSSPFEAGWITASQLSSLTRVPYTMGEYFQYVLGQPHPTAILATHGGIAAVTRDTIKKNPKEVYERAFQRFEESPFVNTEVGFYQERLLAPMFSKRYWLGPVGQ